MIKSNPIKTCIGKKKREAPTKPKTLMPYLIEGFTEQCDN